MSLLKNYKVKTTFVYPGRFFILAENKDEIPFLVKTKCHQRDTKAYSSLHQDMLNGEVVIRGWEFPYTHGCQKRIEEISLSTRRFPLIKKETGINTRSHYVVKVTFLRKGEFYVLAKDKEEARELVLKYCRQRYPRYWSSLPPDEVAWEFPRKNITKIIGEITEIEED